MRLTALAALFALASVTLLCLASQTAEADLTGIRVTTAEGTVFTGPAVSIGIQNQASEDVSQLWITLYWVDIFDTEQVYRTELVDHPSNEYVHTYESLCKASYRLEVVAFYDGQPSSSATLNFSVAEHAYAAWSSIGPEGSTDNYVIPGHGVQLWWSLGGTNAAHVFYGERDLGEYELTMIFDDGFSWGEDGYRTFRVVSVDDPSVQYSYGAFVDSAAPSVRFNSLRDGAVGNGFTSVWDASDANLLFVAYQIDGAGWVMSDRDGPDERIVLGGAPGSIHAIDVMAVDKAGHVTTGSVTVTSSGDPDGSPAVSIASPSSDPIIVNASRAGEGVPLQWDASDPNGDVLAFSISLDGGATWPIDAGAGASALITADDLSALADGQYALALKAADPEGNFALAARTLILDVTPPAIASISVEQPWTDEVDRTTVSWTVTGAERTLASLDGGEWFEIHGGSYEPDGNVSDGDHILRLRFVDDAGNVAEREAAFKMDAALPDVRFISHSDGQWTNSRSIALRWAATDDAVLCQFSADGEQWGNVTGGGLTVNVTEDGRYVFHVRVFDREGNVGGDNVSINVDTVPPEVTITSPRNGSYVDASILTVMYGAADAASGGARVQILVDGVPRDGPVLALEDGSHVIRIVAHDQAGNSAQTAVEFIVDTTLMAISIDPEDPTNDDGRITNRKSVHVSWVSDNVTRALVTLDGGEPVDATGQSGVGFASLDDGVHSVTVALTDPSGRTTIYAVGFTVDTAPPSWTLLEPGDGMRAASPSVMVRWERGDAVAIEIQLDGGDWVRVDAVLGEHALENLSAGPHVLSVRAVDEAGNFDQRDLAFTVEGKRSLMSEPVNWGFIIWAVMLAALLVAMVMPKRGGPAPSAANCAQADDAGAYEAVDELIDDILRTDEGE